MNYSRFIAGLFATSALASSLSVMMSQPAIAGCGFLDVTCNPNKWDSPFPSGNSSGSEVGCPECAVRSTAYRIKNATNSDISYSVNGKNYSLRPGYVQTINATSAPSISFDYNFAPGSQIKKYSLAGSTSFKFVRINSNELDLRRE